jgi:hypothetical protein
MPDTIAYDDTAHRLGVGAGHVENVTSAVWTYEVSGKQVLTQWFSYRGRNRSRPLIGDRRPPSPLGEIQPRSWLPEYTSELLNVLNVLGRLVELEPRQADLLQRICDSPTLARETLAESTETAVAARSKRRSARRGSGRQDVLIE